MINDMLHLHEMELICFYTQFERTMTFMLEEKQYIIVVRTFSLKKKDFKNAYKLRTTNASLAQCGIYLYSYDTSN